MAENNKSSIVWQFFEVNLLDASKALYLVFSIRIRYSTNSKVITHIRQMRIFSPSSHP